MQIIIAIALLLVGLAYAAVLAGAWLGIVAILGVLFVFKTIIAGISDGDPVKTLGGFAIALVIIGIIKFLKKNG